MEIRNARKIVDTLGGVAAVRHLTGQKTDTVVYNWLRFGRFPAYTFHAFQTALGERGHTAPPSLWGQA